MDSDQLQHLFINDIPLLDVRAPIEFTQGAFPCSHNIALLDDEQRSLIGTRYKEQNQDAAIELGWQLATPNIIDDRLQHWRQFVNANPQALLYCFRGGLRSRLSQQLMTDAGMIIDYVPGGYKAMRRYLIDATERLSTQLQPHLIAGRTGSGKTVLINALKNSIDLEGLAKHRGSAFGSQIDGQPTQIDFENNLAVAMLKHQASKNTIVFLEDEGKLIGSLSLPLALRSAMLNAPLIVLDTPMEQRIDITLHDYVTRSRPQFIQRFGAQRGALEFRTKVMASLTRIKKRLGGTRFQQVQTLFEQAFDSVDKDDSNVQAFRGGIAFLLEHYYDPMYDYQQSQRQGDIVFKGTHNDIIEWSNANSLLQS